MPGFLYDSNIWVALTFAAHPHHDRVGEHVKESSKDRPICRLRATELTALRLITTPAIHRAFGVPSFSNAEAIAFLASLFQKTDSVEIEEPRDTRQLWLRLADRNKPSPKVWMDAYLAAVSISGGFDFVTTDRDFQQFTTEGLSVVLVG